MDWANERYVRLYTRDSTTWKLLDWRGRSVLALMMRKTTRAGVVDVDGHGAIGLAALIEMPLEIVEAGLAQLTNPRIAVVHATPTAYVIPNFLEAQEAVQTPAHRSREYRARQRDEAMAGAPTVTKRDATVTKRDATVTKRCNPPGGPSLRSDPNRTDPDSGSDGGEIATSPPEPIAPPPATSRPAVATPDPEINARRELVMWGVAEINRIRETVAKRFGWTDVRPLPPMAPLERDLLARLREDGPSGKANLEHVLRIAELEAVAKRTVEYLGGGIFRETSWAKKLAMREGDVARTIGTKQPTPQTLRVKRDDDGDDMPPLGPPGGGGKQ